METWKWGKSSFLHKSCHSECEGVTITSKKQEVAQIPDSLLASRVGPDLVRVGLKGRNVFSKQSVQPASNTRLLESCILPWSSASNEQLGGKKNI